MRLRRAGVEAPPVARGERALATAAGPGGAVTGTRRALYLPERLAWEEVASATWADEPGELTVTEVGSWGSTPRRWVVALEDAALLLQLVRERVSASVVVRRRTTILGERAVTVVGRRSPDGGGLAWFVEYDVGLDPDDVVVRTAVDEFVQQARSEVGD